MLQLFLSSNDSVLDNLYVALEQVVCVIYLIFPFVVLSLRNCRGLELNIIGFCHIACTFKVLAMAVCVDDGEIKDSKLEQ